MYARILITVVVVIAGVAGASRYLSQPSACERLHTYCLEAAATGDADVVTECTFIAATALAHNDNLCGHWLQKLKQGGQ